MDQKDHETLLNEYLIDYDKYLTKLTISVLNKAPRLEFEDVKQQILCKVIMSAPRYIETKGAHMYTFLSAVAVNEAKSIIKNYYLDKNKPVYQSISLDLLINETLGNGTQISFVEESESSFTNPEAFYCKNEFNQTITDIYYELTPMHQKVVKQYMQGKSIKEIAKRYKKSEKTIYNILECYKKRVKQIIREND